MAEGLIKGVAASVHSVTEVNNNRLQIRGGKDFAFEIDRLFVKLGYGQHRCMNCEHAKVCQHHAEINSLQEKYGQDIMLRVSSCKWCDTSDKDR